MARSRMLRRIAEAVEHHHAVGHGGIDRAEPVFAVQPLGDERHASLDGALRAASSARTARRASAPSRARRRTPTRPRSGAARARRARRRRAARTAPAHARRADCARAASAPAAPAAARSPCAPNTTSSTDGSGNQRGSRISSGGTVGHVAPRGFAIQRKQDAREDIGLDRAAARAGSPRARAPCAAHRAIADHLEREIGFHRRADVEGAVVVERPAAMLAPGCGADRRRSCAPVPGSASRRDNARSRTYSAGMVASASSSNTQWPSGALLFQQRFGRARGCAVSSSARSMVSL